MTVKTNRAMGRTAAAIALAGLMGLGLAACNDSEEMVDKSPESSSSMMSEENKMEGEGMMSGEMKPSEPMMDNK